MKYSILLFLSCFVLISFHPDDTIVMDKKEARAGFTLLNDIRTNTSKYYNEFEFLKNQEMQHTPLAWNDTLARVAEAKAYDMAKRDYFAHVDPDGYGINHFINKSGYQLREEWLLNKSDNYFESCSANPSSGEGAIKRLVVDAGTANLGHRNHLLGNGEWNASLKDIGIGFARRATGSTYQTYVCVIIAKHR